MLNIWVKNLTHKIFLCSTSTIFITTKPTKNTLDCSAFTQVNNKSNAKLFPVLNTAQPQCFRMQASRVGVLL